MWCHNCKNSNCWVVREKPSLMVRQGTIYPLLGPLDIEAIHAHETKMVAIYHPKYEGPKTALKEYDDVSG